MIMETDVASYGRIPEIWSHIINAIRVAYGDFSVIDPNMTFDYKYDLGRAADDLDNYKRSLPIVITTFTIFFIGSFFLFLMFMNIIIAVVNDTYANIK